MASNKLFMAVVAALLVATFEAPARADDVSEAVYSDVKDIITELIEREVAESVAPNLACYSPTGLLKYYPETLQAIYERNFGALKDTLRRETITLVGNYAYRSFVERQSIPLREFLPVKPFNPDDDDARHCADEMKKQGGPLPYQTTIAQQARAQKDGRYYPLDDCSVSFGANLGTTLPCLFAKVVVDSANGLPGTAEDSFGRAMAAAMMEFVTREIPEPRERADRARREALRATLLEEFRARIVNGAAPVGGLVAAFESPDLPAAFKASKSAFRTILALPSSSTRVLATAFRLSTEPDDGHDVRVEMVSTGGTKTRSLADVVHYLQSLPADAVSPAPGERRGCAVARALLGRETYLPSGTVTLTRTDENNELTKFRVVGNPGGPSVCTGPELTWLEELFDAAQRASQMSRLFELASTDVSKQDTKGPVQCGYDVVTLKTAIVQGLIGALQLASDVYPTLKNVAKGDDGTFDFVVLLKSLASGRVRSALCDMPKKDKPPSGKDSCIPPKELSPCDIYTQAVGTIDPRGDLRAILAAVRDKNYRALAVSAVSAVFSESTSEEICCGEKASCWEQVDIYGRFAKSFVSYVLMPRDDEDASLAARTAFKEAAVDVIRSISGRGSIRINPGARILIPTLALRASWSASYRAAQESGLRGVVTVDWPSFRFHVTHDSLAYFGITFSAIDAIAPLTEAVSRDVSTPVENQRTSLIATTFLQPRLSGLFALPGLSDHIGLALGVSERFAGQDKTTKRYVTFYEDGWSHAVDLLEVSAGVVYVP